MSATITSTGSASDRTRDAIVSSARAAFAAKGYADVTVDRIAADAGITKGAVYHHFATKQDLFVAAVEDVEAEVQARTRAASKGQRTPLTRLKSGFGAYLDAVLDPEIGRITLIDAPSVLGAEQYKELSRQYAHDDVTFTLGHGLPDAEQEEIEALASVLLGAVMNAALVVVSSPDQEDARLHAGNAMNRLLEGVLRPTS